MPPLATDQNVDDRIVVGLRRRVPDLDIVSIRDFGLAETRDQDVLEWAASEGRVTLAHDRNTLVGLAYERVARGEPMPGGIEVERRCPVGRAIDDLVILLGCTSDDEWADRVHYIPLR